MTTFDAATEAYLQALVDAAPAPPAEAVALFARSLDPKTTDAPTASTAA